MAAGAWLVLPFLSYILCFLVTVRREALLHLVFPGMVLYFKSGSQATENSSHRGQKLLNPGYQVNLSPIKMTFLKIVSPMIEN